MKNLTILFAAILFSLSATAGHLAGGEIFWECDGNGNYIFTMVIYRDCNGPNLFGPTMDIQSNSPAGTIVCNKIQTVDVSQGCADPLQSISCAKAENSFFSYIPGAFSKIVYQSAPISITTVAPPSGYTFSNSLNSRSAGLENVIGPSSSNLYLHATMFPSASGGCNSNSPRFIQEVQPVFTGKGAMSLMAGTGSAEDSLYYSLVAPESMANQPISFKSGYTFSSPFPDQTENPANGPVTFDNERGLLYYDIAVAVDGLYNYAVKVDKWTNGMIHSSVVRDVSSYLITSSSPNNSPDVSIDTTVNSSISRLNATSYTTYTTVGDTLDFIMSSTDLDFHPNGNSQMIEFEAVGEPLDNVFNTATPLFPSTATLTPVAPQTGFSQIMQNKIRFNWAITADMLVSDSPEYYFTFSFRDDNCPHPNVSHLSLKVVVQKIVEITADTARVCEGNSVQIHGNTSSGNFNWLPNIDITDNTISNPVVSPDSSRYYYLTNPQYPGQRDSIFVEVEPRGTVNLSDQGGTLEIGGTVNLNLFMWYYNDLPFYHPHDTLTPFAPGNYWVKGITDLCVYTSDTVVVPPGGNISTIDPVFGMASDSTVQLPGSLGLNFNLDSSSAGYLKSVYLIGVSTGTLKMQNGSIALKIYETASQAEIFSDNRIIINPNGEIIKIPANIQLDPGVHYTIALSGDSTIFVQTYHSINYPFEPNMDGMQITAAREGQALQFPSDPSTEHLALALEIVNSVGLIEVSGNELQIYPNPAEEVLWISGLTVGAEIQVTDLSGKKRKVSAEYSGKWIKLDVSNLATGVYFLTTSASEDQKSAIFMVK